MSLITLLEFLQDYDVCVENVKNRQKFEDIEGFVWWYNCRRPHQSLKWETMETPYKAFYRKSVDLIRGNCVHMIARIMGGGQECV